MIYDGNKMNSQKLFDAPTKMSIVTTKVTKTIVASSYKNREREKKELEKEKRRGWTPFKNTEDDYGEIGNNLLMVCINNKRRLPTWYKTWNKTSNCAQFIEATTAVEFGQLLNSTAFTYNDQLLNVSNTVLFVLWKSFTV